MHVLASSSGSTTESKKATKSKRSPPFILAAAWFGMLIVVAVVHVGLNMALLSDLFNRRGQPEAKVSATAVRKARAAFDVLWLVSSGVLVWYASLVVHKSRRQPLLKASKDLQTYPCTPGPKLPYADKLLSYQSAILLLVASAVQLLRKIYVVIYTSTWVLSTPNFLDFNSYYRDRWNWAIATGALQHVLMLVIVVLLFVMGIQKRKNGRGSTVVDATEEVVERNAQESNQTAKVIYC